MVAQEYFIWHHKILVHEHNFAESFGQIDVRLFLSLNNCVEMNMDSGEAVFKSTQHLRILEDPMSAPFKYTLLDNEQ